jgi:hypothetical protein
MPARLYVACVKLFILVVDLHELSSASSGGFQAPYPACPQGELFCHIFVVFIPISVDADECTGFCVALKRLSECSQLCHFARPSYNVLYLVPIILETDPPEIAECPREGRHGEDVGSEAAMEGMGGYKVVSTRLLPGAVVRFPKLWRDLYGVRSRRSFGEARATQLG